MEYTILILLLPLLSFLFLGLAGMKLKPVVAGAIGTAVLAVVALLSYCTAFEYFSAGRDAAGMFPTLVPWNTVWLPISRTLHIDLGILLDPISVMMLVVISTVSLMVHVYSLGYMKGERGFQRYYAFLSLFTMSMMGLVVATNIFQMYLFWELVGVSSYLLIGFYYTKKEAVAASKKAFIVTRFADLGFLVGILFYGYYAGTFSFTPDVQLLAAAGAMIPLALGLMFGAPVVMISGFGATLNQYFHIPSAAGSAILAVLAFLTIVFGLRKLIDICGAIGPIIIVISIATGVIYLFQHIGGLTHGIAVAESLPINRIAPMWLISGLYYTTCTPMHSAPFFTATAATVSNKKDAIKGGILGVCLYCLVVTIMTSAIFTNIEYLSTKEVPNLEIANSISPILGLIFVVIIFLGIYSSAVPSMLSMCRSFQKEKTAKYNIFAAVLVGVSLFCATLLPFSQLMNLVYGAYGVIGGVFTIFVFIRVIKDHKAAA